MKKIGMAGFAAAMLAFGAINSAVAGNAAPDSSHVQGQIMVKFRDKAGAAGALRRHGLHEGPGIGDTGAQLIKVPVGKELHLIDALSRNPVVEYAELDQVVIAATDDPFFGRQYALHNGGQSFTNNFTEPGTDPYIKRVDIAEGALDADVDAVEAWGTATGLDSAGNSIKVAILDSGVANVHDDIAPQVVGYANFVSGDTKEDPNANPEDKYGHGTHVAGIVAAKADNSLGVAGVCPACGILDVKVLNDSGSGSSSVIANGISWAANNGAKVINMSLGQRVSSRTLEAAVNNAWSKGAVIVAAAGNNGTQAQFYPGAYTNVIAVAATDNNDVKASFSTYGKWVDVAAPGVSVFSTFPNHPFVLGSQNNRSQGYDIGSGTSMASPIVAAVAALVWDTPAGISNASVREKVQSSAEKINGTGTQWKHGRVNACDAVGCVR